MEKINNEKNIQTHNKVVDLLSGEEIENIRINKQIERNLQIPNKVFNVTIKEDCLNIIFDQYFYDASWAAYFGEVQEALRTKTFNSLSFQHCFVNFHDCAWSSPTPLLSLIIALAEFEDLGGQVEINFPDPRIKTKFENKYIDYVDQSIWMQEAAQFIKFLSIEGFMSLFCEPEIVRLNTNNFNHERKKRIITWTKENKSKSLLNFYEERKNIVNAKVMLDFENATCLPARLLYLGKSNDHQSWAIDQWVNVEMDRTISRVVMAHVPVWQHVSLQHRISNFLKECLTNVAEHAYHESGYACLYVRFREGQYIESNKSKSKLQKSRKNELDNKLIPVLGNTHNKKNFETELFGFFEIFILDAGKGLLRTLDNEELSRTVIPQEPFEYINKIMHRVLIDGFSSKKEREVATPGLRHVRQLLEPVGDYLRIRDYSEWWGTQLPIEQRIGGSAKVSGVVCNTEAASAKKLNITGLSWTGRLSWRSPKVSSELTSIWIGFDTSQKDLRNEILLPFKEKEMAKELQESMQDIIVIDERFKLVKENNDSIILKINKSLNGIIWLPPTGLVKNRIHDSVKKISKNNKVLIISDISTEEAPNYVAALDKAKLPPEICKIILITRSLQCSVFTNNGEGVLSSNHQAGLEFFASETNTDISLKLIIWRLRFHDAQKFWSHSQQHTMVLLAQTVSWTDKIELNGYLDFATALTDPIIRSILERSLDRFSALFPSYDITFKPMDILVDSLIARFSASSRKGIFANTKKNKLEMKVGSVLVTGQTSSSNLADDEYVAHFFHHPDGRLLSTKELILLPWLWPTDLIIAEKSEDSTTQYRRIGRSPVIAQGGWKAFSMPRFKSDGSPIYDRSPRESYASWQDLNRGGLRLGHWRYGGHHDLLTLNLLRSFDSELDDISINADGSLARFIIGNLIDGLGISKTSLSDDGLLLFETWNREKNHKFKDEKNTKNSILLYVSHTTTDHVISKFLSFLKPEVLNEILERIVPLLPLQRSRNGAPLQISGLIFDRLKKIYSKNNSSQVIYFDDALRSGRSFAEVKSLARSAGFNKISSIIMLDRQRLPSALHVDGISHLAYWRIDIPSIGNDIHCPFCTALNKSTYINKFLIHRESTERIKDWKKTWDAVDPTLAWGDIGIKQRPISLVKDVRRFGLQLIKNEDGKLTYCQPGGDKEKIRISTNTGLAAWITELRSITGRDNLYFSIIKQEPDLPWDACIQIACCEIMHFLKNSEQATIKRLTAALWDLLWKAQEVGRETSLAALTLLAVQHDILKDVIIEYLNRNDKNSTDRGQIGTKNIDCRLVAAFVLNMESSVDTYKPLSAVEEMGPIARMLKVQDKAALYYRLHRESRDELGKAHTEPLPRFAKIAAGAKVDIKELIQLRHSVEQLNAVVEKIEYIWLSINSNSNINDLSISLNSLQIDEEGSTARKQLNSAKGSIENFLHLIMQIKANTTSISLDLLASVKNMLDSVSLIHDRLLFPIGISNLREGAACNFEKYISKIILSYGLDIRVHVPSIHFRKVCASKMKIELFEAYAIFDNDVHRALRDFLGNIRHAPDLRPISDVWGEDNALKNSGEAAGWVHVEYNSDGVLIRLANAYLDDHIVLIEKLKLSPVLLDIHTVGGKYYAEPYCESLPNIAITVLRIPFVHSRTL